MRKITEIIIHCADTYSKMDIGRREINQWHRERGFDGIGYHYVIRRNGLVEAGRPEAKQGAHCTGHNAHSIGVCLVGGKGDNGKPENNFTHPQMETLKNMLFDITGRYPEAKIFGHKDFANKACPCFEVAEFLAKVVLLERDGKK